MIFSYSGLELLALLLVLELIVETVLVVVFSHFMQSAFAILITFLSLSL